MVQKNGGTLARESARRKKAKPAKRSRQSPVQAAAPAASRSRMSPAKQMLDVQRNLWKAGFDALSRGGKLAASSTGAARIAGSLQGGLKKLEEVFDQRVIDSLARAAMPSPGELRDLMNRVAKMEAQLRLRSRRRGEI
jgi:hypothetical protein